MNTFGNYKGDMFGDLAYQVTGVSRDDNESAYDEHVSEQREKGCTCSWQLANGWDIQRRENPEWNRCPIHGL